MIRAQLKTIGVILGLLFFNISAYSQEEPILRIPANPIDDTPVMITGFELSPDESMIAITGDCNMVWNLLTGEIIKIFISSTFERWNSVDFSSDGKLLALATKYGIYIYETEEYETLYSLPVPDLIHASWPGIFSITFYPDDSLLIYTTQSQLDIWDYRNVNLLKTMRYPIFKGPGVYFIDDGYQNVFLPNTSTFLNLETGLEIEPELDIKPEILENMSWGFSNDEFILTGEYIDTEHNERIISLYDRNSQEMIWTYTHDYNNTHRFRGMDLSSDGKLLVVSGAYCAKIIDCSAPESPTVVRTLTYDLYDDVLGLKFTKDRDRLVVAIHGEILVYDISDLGACVDDMWIY